MSVKLVFLILGIIFYVVRHLSKSGENNKPQRAKTAKKPVSRKATNKPKSIDDIFNEFVKEVETANKKTVKKPIQAQTRTKSSAKKSTLDWQKVDKSHIQPRKQLIDHDDYHNISHRVDKEHQTEGLKSIYNTEGEVFEFDSEGMDWRQAIISKEILDRKYV